jgi:hypothetical protein
VRGLEQIGAQRSAPRPGDPEEARSGSSSSQPLWPLVAICGLTAGTGTSTLAWLLARAACAAGNTPLLLCELESAAGGLARVARQSSARSLGELALRGGRGLPAFAEPEPGLRLIATEDAPATSSEASAAVPKLLRAARSAHVATIVDCGSLEAGGGSSAIDMASHVIWVLGANARAAETVVEALLDRDPGISVGVTQELVAAVARDGAGSRVDLALRDAVAERAQRLVLVPDLGPQKSTRADAWPDALRCALSPLLEFVGLRRSAPPWSGRGNARPLRRRLVP